MDGDAVPGDHPVQAVDEPSVPVVAVEPRLVFVVGRLDVCVPRASQPGVEVEAERVEEGPPRVSAGAYERGGRRRGRGRVLARPAVVPGVGGVRVHVPCRPRQLDDLHPFHHLCASPVVHLEPATAGRGDLEAAAEVVLLAEVGARCSRSRRRWGWGWRHRRRGGRRRGQIAEAEQAFCLAAVASELIERLPWIQPVSPCSLIRPHEDPVSVPARA